MNKATGDGGGKGNPATLRMASCVALGTPSAAPISELILPRPDFFLHLERLSDHLVKADFGHKLPREALLNLPSIPGRN